MHTEGDAGGERITDEAAASGSATGSQTQGDQSDEDDWVMPPDGWELIDDVMQEWPDPKHRR